MKRLAPVVLLLLLSPLIAEYLLGSLSLAQIGVLPVMVFMYGSGAVLIRETARRALRGWPTILLLGLAYGILEEGIADQSLFNPHFRGLHLIAYGFVPQLGLALPWTLDVLALHVVWSIGVPIALVEALFPSRQPWMGKIGLGIVAAIYATGVAMVFFVSAKQEHFLASALQLGASAAAILAVVALAFALPRLKPKPVGGAPHPLLVAVLALAAGSGFEVLYSSGANTFHWSWQNVAGGMAAIALGMLVFGLAAARRSGWTGRHVFALAAGGFLTYAWFGFGVEKSLHGPALLWAHAILVVALTVLVIFAGLKAWKAPT